MKAILLLIFFIACKGNLFGQGLGEKVGKPSIDTGAFNKWLSVKTTDVGTRVGISYDGKYAFYVIREHWRRPAICIIKAINGSWKSEFTNVENAEFTEDSRKAVFLNTNDSLGLLTLGSSFIEYISGVSSFQLFMQGATEYMLYQLNTPDKKLIVRNLMTGTEQSFTGVSQYLLTSDGNNFVLITESKKDTVATQMLSWISLIKGNTRVIWEGIKADNLILNNVGSQLAFVVNEESNKPEEKSIWYYKVGTEKATLLAGNQSVGINNLRLDGISNFSIDGSRLFISLKERDNLLPKPDAIKVDIWSYRDAKIQSQQLQELWPGNYEAVLHLNDRRIIRLQKENESRGGKDDDNYRYVINRKAQQDDDHWNAAAKAYAYIVSTENGDRKQLKENFKNDWIDFSPNGKFLVGFDQTWSDFYSYEITTGVMRNLTQTLAVPTPKMIEKDDLDRPRYKQNRGLGVIGWMDDGNVLISDDYDIWEINPQMRTPPINLTNGYGRKKKIVFSLPGMYSGKTFSANKIIAHDADIILAAFDKTNKNSGFYKIVSDEKRDPELLTMGPYVYDHGYNGRTQIKARDAEVYIVMRESAAESPNYFWTKDFKTFTRLSSVFPEKAYNWLTSELMTFKTLDGRSEHAVLYKPENFDPKKKYPVILHYYERRSQNLNQYFPPGMTGTNNGGGHLDIPWFVSHGYIVLTPDIHYNTGEIGQSAYNSIVAAAKSITKYPWIDAKSLGMQGYSFGGYETNYVVTRSHLFAAAVSTSASSDLVSGYGTTLRGGNHSFTETVQPRMGATLWERPDLYIKNSPIFRADKIKTPILLISNKMDANVSFAQGLEWFLALRRLGKKAWMLQYDEESHGVGGDKNYNDYIIRMTQFFDHYLKEAPGPKWMTRGVPANMKGVEDGLEIDDEIKSPGEGLLTPDQKKKVEALNNKKPVTIILD